ncbi:MAG: pilus assembly protein TadG-related protein [bacterium]|nr:pilus assembly protein TadG-related protein [bacterium]
MSIKKRSSKSENRSAQAMVMVAIMMVVLLVAAGMGVDIGYIYLSRNRLQNMVDAAVLAGSQELPSSYDAKLAAAQCYAQNVSPSNPPMIQAIVTPVGADPNASYYTIGNDQFQAITPYTISGNQRPPSQLMKTRAVRQLRLFFMPVIGIRTFAVSAEASGSNGGGYGSARGMVVLDPNGGSSFQLTGNAEFNVPNGCLVVDSTADNAMSLNGNVRLSTLGTYIVGNYRAWGNIHMTPTPLTGQVPSPDPLIQLPVPSTTGLPSFAGQTIQGNSSVTLNPGIYTGRLTIRGNADVFFNPGTYIFRNGIEISGNADVNGSNVLIYNQGGELEFTGNTDVDLTPATTGTYAGITIFQARDNHTAMTVTSNADWSIQGTFYLPNAELDLQGNIGLIRSMVIAYRIAIIGNSWLQIDASEPTSIIAPTGGILLEE